MVTVPAREEGSERRVAPRTRTLKRARVLFNNRFSTFDCVVRNVSRTGALLTIDPAVHLPKEFEVGIGEDGVRRAKLVYRREMFAGIHFLDIDPEEDMSVSEADADAPLMPREPGANGLRIEPMALPPALSEALPWSRYR